MKSQPGRHRADVRDAVRERDQHRDDLDELDPHLVRGARRAVADAVRALHTAFGLDGRLALDSPHARRRRRSHGPGRHGHARDPRASATSRSSELRFFASSRSAGTTLDWRGSAVEVEDAATADFAGLDVALMSSGATSSRELAPATGRRRRDRDRQLLGVAHGPRRAARRRRGQRPRARLPSQGDRRQPQLHDDGGDAGAEAAARRRRAAVDGGLDLPGRQRRGPRGRRRARRQLEAARDLDVRALTFDGSALARGPGRQVPRRRSRTTSCPLAGSLVDDGSFETDEEQKLRDESRKILEIPDLRRGPHVRAGAGLHRPLALDHRGLRAGRSHPRRRPPCSKSRRGVVVRDAADAALGAGRDPTYVGRMRRADAVGERAVALRHRRQPAQGRGAQRRADRRGAARVAASRRRRARPGGARG